MSTKTVEEKQALDFQRREEDRVAHMARNGYTPQRLEEIRAKLAVVCRNCQRPYQDHQPTVLGGQHTNSGGRGSVMVCPTSLFEEA